MSLIILMSKEGLTQIIQQELQPLKDQLTQLIQLEKRELDKENEIMATLQDLQDKVTAENTVIDSAIALINGLAEQVRNLQPDQAAIDALAAEIDAKKQALADAVTANTTTT